MGKRSTFPSIGKDKYRTWDKRAGPPLAQYLPWNCMFWEPCAARGDLVAMIESYGPTCVVASDKYPEHERVFRLDALTVTKDDFAATGATHIITNPPWTRSIMHPMIELFSGLAPTWLLFDADWVHTKQATPYLPWLRKIVSVGRLKWIPGSEHTGKDNCAWHLFDQRHSGPTEFLGRVS
jgi:hypothetical protein